MRTRTALEPVVVTILANWRVYPRSRMKKEQNMVPASMYGRLLPNRDFEVSASNPMIGWTTRPEMGPAMKTIAIPDLDSPKEIK